MKKANFIDKIVTCKLIPSDNCTLEGYQLNETYKAQFVEFLDYHQKSYWRLWPETDCPDYYETCTKMVFHKHFSEVVTDITYSHYDIDYFLRQANSDLGSGNYKPKDMVIDYCKAINIGKQLRREVDKLVKQLCKHD